RLARVGALHKAHRKEWELEVAAWARNGPVDFCRGFVSHLDATAEQWLKGAAGLHRSAPVTDLPLTNAAGRWGELAPSPQVARVSTLVMLGGLASSEEAAALAASPQLGRLRSLRLISAAHHGGLRTLLEALRPGLLALLLEYCVPYDGHAAALANNPASRSL